MKLGAGPRATSRNPYNKGFGAYGEMGARAARTAAAIAAVQNVTRAASAAGRINRFVNAVELAYQLYAWLKDRPHDPYPVGWDDPHGGQWICGGSGGSHVLRYSYVPPGFGFCGLKGQSLNETTNKVKYSWLYGRRYPVTGGQYRWDVTGIYSIASGGDGVYPSFRSAPQPFVPIVAPPLPFSLASAASSTYPTVPPPPRRPVLPPKFRDKPPQRRTHERKGQAQEAVGRMVQAAFAVTEGVDALDALWDALPDDVKRKTAKSGVARKGAFIGEGTRYSTPMDKFWALYRNYRSLNLSQAAKNLLINHIVDKIIGTMSAKGADKLRKKLGASGWGNII